ncbi:MAG: hypothetical protein KJO75_01730 [Dactylosporangium sp.]|nr:hypothetical protein [Dactylosporangium sp.]
MQDHEEGEGGKEMVDLGGWPFLGGGGLLAVTMAAHAGRLLRSYLGYRERSLAERERSARAQVRTAGLVRLAGDRPVRMRERDCDGDRLIEFGHGTRTDREAA